MASMGLTIAELATQAGVDARTIQGWLTEGRRPRPIPLVKVENVVGSLADVAGLDVPRPPSRAEVLKRLRAAERAIREAREILDHLSD